jgi:hypothetical protein
MMTRGIDRMKVTTASTSATLSSIYNLPPLTHQFDAIVPEKFLKHITAVW